MTMDKEQLLLDFLNSGTIDEILNEYLGLPLGKPIPKTDIQTREEIARKHIKDFLDKKN